MTSDISKQFKEYEKTEPILSDKANRLTVFPLKYPEVWEMYKKAEASFWTCEEIDLGQDNRDWLTLDKDEQRFILHVLAFFAASDGLVLENLSFNFCREVMMPEARAFYGFQEAIENVHSEMYSLLIEQYIQDSAEKDKLFRAVETIPIIGKKAQWFIKWMNNERSFAERIVAYACIEGILFSASFCAIFWVKKRGLMPGLTFSNELISRDEGLHADFACLIYSMLQHQLPESTIHDIVKECLDVEREFVKDALRCDLIGMNSNLMIQYVEFVADRLLVTLGYNRVWNVENPFEWMELISLQGKTNFFEKRVGEYQRKGVMLSVAAEDKENVAGKQDDGCLGLNEDF